MTVLNVKFGFLYCGTKTKFFESNLYDDDIEFFNDKVRGFIKFAVIFMVFGGDCWFRNGVTQR